MEGRDTGPGAGSWNAPFAAGVPLGAAFFLSGASALVYELLWFRLLGHIFGSTATATSTLLAAYLCGLGIGAWLFGRISDRIDRRQRLLLYAGVEAAIGFYGLASHALLERGASLYALVHEWASGSPGRLLAGRFAVSFVLVAIPTTLMGGTFPLMVLLLRTLGVGVGRATGRAYSVNTAGAAAGTLGLPLLLMPRLGVAASLGFAAAANLVAAALALLVWFGVKREAAREDLRSEGQPDRFGRPDGRSVPGEAGLQAGAAGLPIGTGGLPTGTGDLPTGTGGLPTVTGGLPTGTAGPQSGGAPHSDDSLTASTDSLGRSFPHRSLSPARSPVAGVPASVLGAFFFSSFAALALEAVWTRHFGILFGTKIHVFAFVLFAYLVGLFLGGGLYARLAAAGRRPVGLLRAGLLLGAAGTAAPIPFLDHASIPQIDLMMRIGLTYPSFLASTALIIIAIVIVPAVGLGLVFPAVVEVLARAGRGTGASVGVAYAVNTLGTTLGALAAGFLLVPLLGSQRTLEICVLALAAALVLSYSASLQRLPTAPTALSPLEHRPPAPVDRTGRQDRSPAPLPRTGSQRRPAAPAARSPLEHPPPAPVARTGRQDRSPALLPRTDSQRRPPAPHPGLWKSLAGRWKTLGSRAEGRTSSRAMRARAGLWKPLLLAACFLGVLAFPRWDWRFAHSQYVKDPLGFAKHYSDGSLWPLVQSYEILSLAEGTEATVSVCRFRDGSRSLFVNGKADASNILEDVVVQRLLGFIPVLFHPDPKRALVIGLGSGTTVSMLGQFPLESIDAAEISPEVGKAARAHFAEINMGILDDPRVSLRLDDGRNFLAFQPPGSYDIIVSEPSNPWMTGVSPLFTDEFFAEVRDKLRDGGIACQWFHFYSMSVDHIRLLARTFQRHFPEAAMFVPRAHLTTGDILLVGSKGPLRLARLPEDPSIPPSARKALAQVLNAGNQPVLGALIDGPQDLSAFIGAGPLNTDDRPLLELEAPADLFLQDFFGTLAALVPPSGSAFLPAGPPKEAALPAEEIARAGFALPSGPPPGSEVRRGVRVIRKLPLDKDPLCWVLIGREFEHEGVSTGLYRLARPLEGPEEAAEIAKAVAGSKPESAIPATVNGHPAAALLAESATERTIVVAWNCPAQKRTFFVFRRLGRSSGGLSGEIASELIERFPCAHPVSLGAEIRPLPR